MTCAQPGCGGQIVDGYCDVCGMAPPRAASAAIMPGAPSGAVASGAVASGAVASGVVPSTATVSRRTGSTGTRASTRNRLGAGLVSIPAVPQRDPATAIMANPTVPEARRFCAACDEPVGRGRDGAPGRSAGFCRKCGTAFSFDPTLHPGDLVGGQYEVVGCLAHGGLGWVYLARDHNVSDRWVVLKGLLNASDGDAATAAVAERRFLAEVEHPNIVKIFNFVEHDRAGYIVMEYIGGLSLKQLLAARREAAGRVDPLPPAEAVAYIVEILPALGHLHENGLLFCDFKLDNVIQTRDALKLIDLGGVVRVDEPASAIFGTVGYQAPEIATSGPTIASDLFTVARALAVMVLDFRGYQSTFRYTLPDVADVPLFQQQDALYRLLAKGTAQNPDDRFQSAEEMGEQLYGILRELVAESEGRAVAAASTLFTVPAQGTPDRPDWRALPRPQVAADDPGTSFLATITVTDPAEALSQLRAAPIDSREIELRLAAALIESGDVAEAQTVLEAIDATDRWEWRTRWHRGVAALKLGTVDVAHDAFMAVYAEAPGELAPKLALGVTAEYAGDLAGAVRWYEIVARTDRSITSAAFGLARCRLAAGDRLGAIAAYERVAESSSAYLDAQTARIRALIAGTPTRDALLSAGAALGQLTLDAERRERLTVELLTAALPIAMNGSGLSDDGRTSLLGHRLVERDVRFGLERAYRSLARRAGDRNERIRLVDEANRSRPRTWT